MVGLTAVRDWLDVCWFEVRFSVRRRVCRCVTLGVASLSSISCLYVAVLVMIYTFAAHLAVAQIILSAISG